MEVQFKQWKCKAIGLHYSNNIRKCIRLIDVEDGAPVATATVNIPDFNIKEDQVIIKDYSENEGMSRALYEAGIIGSFPRVMSLGLDVKVFDLTKKALDTLWTVTPADPKAQE